ALFRLAAPLIALGVLLGGCGQTPPSKDQNALPGARSGAAQSLGGNAAEPADGAGRLTTAAVPLNLPAGSAYRNPANGRDEVIVEDIRRTAVLIGDSQSEPLMSWPRQALAAVGYKVYFCGLSGTGFVAANGKTGNFITALERGDWKLPYGEPPLVVVEGGGNDAARGATDAQIVSNAERLIGTLRERYPGSRFAMIGTLARGANHGGGRRTQVDTLLGSVAEKNAIPFVSVGDWLTRYSLTDMLADGLHVNARGHGRLGELLTSRLRSLGLAAPDSAAKVAAAAPGR
ncbi:MAG: SGNH/GDSL hydrolase family protein, partial [Pseudarthrobacter sp.]